MTEPIPSSGYGDADWVDLSNNWRDADATWLQERSIVRLNTSNLSGETPTSAAVANFTAGRVFYNDNDKTLNLSTSTTSPYSFKVITASKNLTIKDGASTSELKASAATDGTGIAINNTTGAVTIGAATMSSTLAVTGATTLSGYLTSLKVGSSGVLSTSSSGLVIDTTGGSGTNAVTITTSTAVGSATTLEINKPVKITGSINTTTDANVSGGLSVTGTSALAVTTVSSTLNVTGTSTLGTVNAGAVTLTGLLAANGNITIGGTTPTLTAAATKDLTISIPTGKAIRVSGVSVSDADFFYGSTSARNAWVIYSATDPGIANYPAGTIWIS